jgi:uncharacterized Zn finger protein
VKGGERYAVTVWCDPERKKGGALHSRCTCPVGADGCKHAVAVVAEYLELLREEVEFPAADADDERWAMLSGEDDEAGDDVDDADDLDSDDAVVDQPRRARSSETGKRARQIGDDKIRKHIDAKSREELVALLWSLTERFPELGGGVSRPDCLGRGQCGPILQSLHRSAEWTETLADIRLRYRNRPRFMVILDKLDSRPIMQQRQSRN